MPPWSHLTSYTHTKSNLYLANSLAVSQPPLRWLKVHCYVEVTGISQEDKLFSPFHTQLSAGNWLLWGSERQESSPRFLGGFGGHGLLITTLDSSTRSSLWFGCPACGGDCCSDFPVGLRRRLAYVKEAKLVWFLGEFKFQFQSCILAYWALT